MPAASPVPQPHRSGSRRPARNALRWLVIVASLLLLALALVAAITVGPLLLAPNEYADVPSIERRADYRDPTLLDAAWSLPVARAYRADGFEYQANPSFCGPASVANLLQSVGIPLDQNEVIDDTAYDPWFGILVGGLTLDELADLLALRLGRRVTVVRNAGPAEFRAWLRRANDPAVRVVANFHRGPLFGRGHGHFSPVLAYLDREDLVLVGDVNREYRPFLVSSERLWRATGTVDSETGRERGLIVAEVGKAP